MPNFTKYTHVERLGKAETEGLLQNEEIYVTAKIDGTNASVWKNGDTYRCGSRTRELTAEKDNAGFYAWFNSSGDEQNNLKSFLDDFPYVIVYGEWTGSNRFVGNIKDYDSSALGQFFIFDVYETINGLYFSDKDWREELAAYGLEEYFTEILAVLNYPVMEDIEKIARENKFLLGNANHAGEGVVLKCESFRNKYGNQCYGKFVLDEYIQSKRENKKKAQIKDVEEFIVERYATDAEIAKALAKCELHFDEPFNNHCGAHIGFLLSTTWNDSVLEEMSDILKKTKMPVIDFRRLQNLVQNKCKKYAGIG